jgi:signal transduction histidine kinase
MSATHTDRTAEAAISENPRLRRCVCDLVALSALPALWAGRDPAHIAESLADALLSVLRSELVYIGLRGRPNGFAIEAARTAGHPSMGNRAQEIGAELACWLKLDGASLAADCRPPPAIPNPVGRGTLRLAVARIGYEGEWGVIAVGSSQPEFPTELDRLALNVAANQAAIALQDVRNEAALRASEARYRELSDELEQRVRERTAELTRTVEALDAEVVEREQAERSSRAQSRALTRVLEQLTREPRFERFPGILLAAIVEQFEASGGTLWIYDEVAGCFERMLDYEGGRIVLAEDPDRPFPQQRVDNRKIAEWEGLQAALLGGECVVTTDFAHDPALEPSTWAAYAAMGIRTALAVPMLLQGRLLGCCVLRSTHQENYGPRDFALAQALAHQATLALQLTRLAEQARQTAVLQERERAAQERAAELARENQALLQTLDALAGKPELEQFLGTVIAAITEQLGAVSSSLWLFDWEAQTASLALVYQDRRVVPASESGHPQPVLELTSSPNWVDLIQERRAVIHEVAAISSELSATRDYLVAQDVQKAVLVPLALGENVIGAFNTRFRAETPIAPEKIELAHALAHQATLAIQMSRLAKQARQTAVLEERNRMAGEIHDGLGQAFTGILLQLGAAERLLALDPAQGHAHLQHARDLAREGLVEARRSVWALRPQALEETDLDGALQRMAEQLNAGQTTRITFRLNGAPRPLRSDVADHLLRIGQEALTNALRHAQASEVGVELTFAAEELTLRVSDDGRGFAMETESREGGFGLTGMQARAGLIGAQLTVASRPGCGTQVEVTWRFPPG